MSTALTQLSSNLAAKFGMTDTAGVMQTLKATAFKGQVSDAQMTALLIVANQYGLNPWTKEIYAFPDRNNGIVPVVGVDGWSRIMNEHPQFDGMEFEQDDESCTCKIYRKDRSRPVATTEYLSECKRKGVGPWESHPKRMLRHKALIQCARLAFGFTGIYDQDEAERIVERDITPRNDSPAAVAHLARAPAQDTPDRAPIIAKLEAVANCGDLTALADAWQSIGPAGRKAVGAEEWARIKDMAEFAQPTPAINESELPE
jgi:hypothetical protein